MDGVIPALQKPLKGEGGKGDWRKGVTYLATDTTNPFRFGRFFYHAIRVVIFAIFAKTLQSLDGE